jgi:glycosyltransferase involved in cell wall biosynthesis
MQDLNEDEYEVICVNDCSTDSTPDILKKYQSIHKNFHIINHPVNKKLGATRNTGVAQAKGKYLWFIDGDDMIKHNCFSNLLKICESDNLDELLFNHETVKENNEFIEKDLRFSDSEVFTGLSFVKKYFPDNLSSISMVWSQLYRTDYLKTNNFKSPEINLGEDGPLAWATILKANKVKSISEAYYIYRSNESSMTLVFRKFPSPVKLFERSVIYSLELVKLYDEYQKVDVGIANDLAGILKWSVNSFYEVLMNEYKSSNRKEYYLLSRDYYLKNHRLKSFFYKNAKRSVLMMKFGFFIWNMYFHFLGFISGSKK